MTVHHRENSHRTSLGAFSRMGAASTLQAVSGIIRVKLVAVMLGPAGVGVFGLMLSLTQTLALIGTFGQDLVGPRKIAQSRGSDAVLARNIWALGALLAGLALVSGLVVLLMRAPLARLLGMPGSTTEVVWLSLAVALTVLATLPMAVLQGLRRIAALSRTNASSALGSLMIGGGTVLMFGREGLVFLLISAPACLLLVGMSELITAIRAHRRPRADLRPMLRDLAKNGAPYMLASVVVITSTFAARAIIQHMHGTESLGLYTAATTVGLSYMPILLGALGADYLPRLASALHHPDEIARLVAEQTEVALLIVAPVAVGVIAFAPWVMSLMFSIEFRPAALILQLQVLADILRVSVWPLGFVLLARGEGVTHFFIEVTGQLLFLLATLGLVDRFGLLASGAAYLVLSISASVLSLRTVGRRIELVRNDRTVAVMAVGLLLGLITLSISRFTPVGGAAFGGLCAIGFGAYSIVRIVRLAEIKGRIGAIASTASSAMSWVGFKP